MLSEEDLRRLAYNVARHGISIHTEITAGELGGLTARVNVLGQLLVLLHTELEAREQVLAMASDPRTMAYYLPGLDNPALREG